MSTSVLDIFEVWFAHVSRTRLPTTSHKIYYNTDIIILLIYYNTGVPHFIWIVTHGKL